MSSSLRSIADRISASKKPDPTRVASSIRRVLLAMKDMDDMDDVDDVDDVPNAGLIALDQVRPIKSDIRKYTPIGPRHAYPIIDGRFEFALPGGKSYVFDGHIDDNDQQGRLTCDGEDLTDQLWESGGDAASLEFMNLDADLDSLLTYLIEKTPA
ncbi:MAG TPA: hypothetical protein VIE65_02350 [Methylobacter sp.]